MNRLHELRKERGLTLRQLNNLTGISDVNLSRYERGTVQPKEETWRKLAYYYGVQISYLKGTDKEFDTYLENMVDKNLRLKELRESENNVSQADIAKTFHITRQAVQRWEVGKSEPNIKTLIALADYFNVSIDYLVGRSDVR